MVRAYQVYGRSVGGLFVPQHLPIPGRTDMVVNNAGGYGFQLDHWDRLKRFLILGSEDGTYYVGKQKLTAQNADNVIRCLQEDGVRTVEMARDINIAGSAPKVDPQLFLLALAMKHGDLRAKNAARLAARGMLRIGTHVLHLAGMLDNLGGWNRSKRRILRNWFRNEDVSYVAFQALKYQSRDGWSMRDLLRVAHPNAPSIEHAAVFDWICGRTEMSKFWPKILADHATMIKAMTEQGIAAVLEGLENGLPREAIPTEYLGDVAVQQALMAQAPVTALIRNLAAWTSSGAIQPGTPETRLVAGRICNPTVLRKARVHPFALMLAALVYREGHGMRSSRTWVPVREILDALDTAYEDCWEWQKPHGKRVLISIDTSGSMDMACQGTPIAASTAAGALALTLARQEPFTTVIECDDRFQRVVPVTKRTALSTMSVARGSGTDLAAPVYWAMQNGAFEAIIILTDNETWAGHAHCTQVIQAYRKSVSPNCKLIVAAMAANHASVVDPEDPLQLGIAGLDANLPRIIHEFITEND